jgi:hypothetical protein
MSFDWVNSTDNIFSKIYCEPHCLYFIDFIALKVGLITQARFRDILLTKSWTYPVVVFFPPVGHLLVL